MVSQHTGGAAGESTAAAADGKMRTNSNFRGWSLGWTARTQFYRYHSKNHHLNELKLPLNSYIEQSPIDYGLIQDIDYWDLERDYSKPLRNH